MTTEILTDASIDALLRMPKRVENPGARAHTVGKHIRKDYRVVGEGGKQVFALFTRQSIMVSDNFSAGLRWLPKSGESVMLIRCNGPSHPHLNAIEGEKIQFICHVHKATERYITAGKKEESFAFTTDSFSTLAGAMDYLVKRCNIYGLVTEPDQPTLFD
jgi:hypothetical protein